MNYIGKAIVVCVLICISLDAMAQNDYREVETNQHSFYLEGAGSAYYYSVNYEFLINTDHQTHYRNYASFFGRVGVEYLPMKPSEKMINIPVAINGILGKRHSRIEIGMGALIRSDFKRVFGGQGFVIKTPFTRVFFTPCIGYRYLTSENVFGETIIIRVTFTPLMFMNVYTDTPFFVPWGGISIGKTF